MCVHVPVRLQSRIWCSEIFWTVELSNPCPDLAGVQKPSDTSLVHSDASTQQIALITDNRVMSEMPLACSTFTVFAGFQNMAHPG